MALPLSIETKTPAFLSPMFPVDIGSYDLKAWDKIPYPLVKVINSVVKPIKPLDGTVYSNLVWLSKGCMFSIFPPRLPNDSITGPTYSSGTSISTSSYGSHLTPSISLMIIWGLETSIS